MKSRLVLLACCLALLSSCGQGDKGTGKAPEFAVIEAKTTTANLTNSYPATIKGKQDVEIRPMVSGFITKLHVDEGAFTALRPTTLPSWKRWATFWHWLWRFCSRWKASTSTTR